MKMIVVLDGFVDEDMIQEIVDMKLAKYKESANLVSSITDTSYVTRKSLKKKYKEFIKSTPTDFLDEFNIHSFEDYALEYWDVIGFVGEDPIIRFNPEALFEDFTIDAFYQVSEVDPYDIVYDIDYLLDKDDTLYELETYEVIPKGFIRILQQCDFNDFIVVITGID